MAPSLTLASADVDAFEPSGRALDWNRCGRRARGLSFARRVAVPFEASVARLNEWMTAHGGAAEIGRSRVISRPPGSDNDRMLLEVSLGRGSTGRSVPMELELIRWSPTLGTAIELQPRRDVRPSARYFNAGHALLDAVVAIIDSGRDAA